MEMEMEMEMEWNMEMDLEMVKVNSHTESTNLKRGTLHKLLTMKVSDKTSFFCLIISIVLCPHTLYKFSSHVNDVFHEREKCHSQFIDIFHL